ncbi:TonB-dependent receptor [Dyella halodurans]|uniref:TonB-dependent receptor plug domain-containing protein n=1 Tax=Dyella halodurans TaxID=1920171 RepID=A0ABV9C786_9GAMM|nr:TonB-dependent receptor [Dyella halodurans]
MQSNYNRLSIAVRLALTVGMASAAAMAQAQDANSKDASTTQGPAAQGQTGQAATEQPKQSNAKTLTAVSVTGSLIRRVDAETASPVVTLDRSAISNNGSPTLGNVLQALPSISGNATNTQNNSNGGGGASPTLEGGDGAARVSLRGLGVYRTLVLVDGQRLANADVNMIPQNMIERIDVLAEGASTVYGSDAIGGVVNFILRKDYQGAELSVNDGISDHGDGQRHGAQFTAGANSENGNIVLGIDYNHQSPVLATRRDFSAHQLYLSSGVVTPAGSGTIPTGRLLVPAAQSPGCAPRAGTTNTYVTLAGGSGNSLSDYRCYGGAGDTFNYNAYNYIQTEQTRNNIFLLTNYKLADHLTFFLDAFYNHTSSSGQDAPAPTSTADGWVVPSTNPNNPFGVTFSANSIPGDPNSGYPFSTRLTGLGTRLHTFVTDNQQVNTGLRGAFGNSTWIWDASVDYGYSKRVQRNYNEVNVPDFQAAIDAGANIFNQADPAVTALLRKGVDTPVYTMSNTMKQGQFNTSGELWDLPAGAMQLSAGALYRDTSMSYNVTPDAILNPATGTCIVLSEACGSPGGGSVNVSELYAETLVPLLSDKPWAYALNVDIGVRSSHYNTTGTTTNSKIAIEYRPVADLLIRGTASQVFRAPNLDELYDGRTVAGPTVTDPCVGLTSAQLAQHTAACQYVPPQWAGNPLGQVTAYYSGAVPAGSTLKPEHGNSISYGFVYSPSWANGLSTSVDVWRINLHDLLTPIAAQTVLNSCFTDNANPYCSFINRYNSSSQLAGAVNYINTPVVNLGNLSTSGVDFTLNYVIPHFDIGGVNPGNFKAGLNTTYTSTYNNNATPGQPGPGTVNYAGTYTQQFGNIARWRGTLTLNWALGNWSAQWQGRYIHRLTNLNADYTTGANAPMASVLYQSITAGYEIPQIHTRFDIGVDNLSDKTPPLIYQNGQNFNTDTSTYDTLGRYYWARATVKF